VNTKNFEGSGRERLEHSGKGGGTESVTGTRTPTTTSRDRSESGQGAKRWSFVHRTDEAEKNNGEEITIYCEGDAKRKDRRDERRTGLGTNA